PRPLRRHSSGRAGPGCRHAGHHRWCPGLLSQMALAAPEHRRPKRLAERQARRHRPADDVLPRPAAPGRRQGRRRRQPGGVQPGTAAGAAAHVAMIHFGPGAFAAAFAAGIVSFISPCVLPLIPGYLSFVSGVGFDELGARPRRVARQTAWFVLGFGVMFALFGAGAAWFGNALLVHRRSLEIAAGAFIVFAGLIYAGLPLPALLLAEKRLRLRRERSGPVTALVAGVAFAIGWTPCIGPTLAAILTLAAGEGHAEQGAVLLLVYALGLGVPFLAFGLAFPRALGLARALRRRWRLVSVASGTLLVAFGVLLATGELIRLTSVLSRFTGLTV